MACPGPRTVVRSRAQRWSRGNGWRFVQVSVPEYDTDEDVTALMAGPIVFLGEVKGG